MRDSRAFFGVLFLLLTLSTSLCTFLCGVSVGRKAGTLCNTATKAAMIEAGYYGREDGKFLYRVIGDVLVGED